MAGGTPELPQNGPVGDPRNEPGPKRASTDIRLAELLAALSLATDAANAFPPETALRSCLLAVQLGSELGVSGSELSDIYYLTMLRYLGCTAFAHEEAAAFGGNDRAFRNAFAGVDFQQPREVLGAMLTRLGRDSGPAGRVRAIRGFVAGGKALAPRMFAANCEVASRLAQRLGLSRAVVDGLGHVFARWDGKGAPGSAAGEAIPLPARVTSLTHAVVSVMQHSRGFDATSMVRRRAGTEFDPTLADAFVQRAEQLMASIAGESVWEAALYSEPESRPWLPASRVDAIATAFADFADLKSPYTLGHSQAVASLAASAAQAMGMGSDDVAMLRRAGLLHHVGRVSVANGIWDKPGRLGGGEWERVRLYPYHTQRIVSRAPALRPLAPLAGGVQERLDGSGYHRGLPATALPTLLRVLAAADAYQAMTEERPHRVALAPPLAARELSSEVDAGRLDREAVAAVLGVAGHEIRERRATWPAGLTDREVEVLRLVAQARPTKLIATQLFISQETVKNHIKHIYDKVGVSSRSGAALFALENDLLRR